MYFIIAGLAGSLATLVAGTVIALLMQPWIAPQFGPYVRTESDGLLFPALLSGYLIIGFSLAFISRQCALEKKTTRQVMGLGMVIGLAIFLGDHLITAGWSYLPVGAMAVSGVLDSFAIVAGFMAVYYVYRFQPAATT